MEWIDAMNPRLFSFNAGASGEWNIRSIEAISGDSLPTAAALSVALGQAKSDVQWTLRGVTSNERYVTMMKRKNC